MSGIYCPCCGQTRWTKREWKPSQWAACRADVFGFNCCKICSPDGHAAAPASAQADALERVLVARRAFQSCTANGWHAEIERFLEVWVASPKAPRKYASYYGALVRGAQDPRGSFSMPDHASSTDSIEARQKPKYLDPEDYLDPGNWYYKLCLELL